MYIIELLIKLIKKKPGKKLKENIDLEDVQDCNHIFFPIDSDKEFLACSKCGFLIKNPQKKGALPH
ncbi:MAG: hypothetical protein WC197_09305 [Candidatus Gastranaerophilaceae bacterium]|jgi:hypothetical protein